MVQGEEKKSGTQFKQGKAEWNIIEDFSNEWGG